MVLSSKWASFFLFVHGTGDSACVMYIFCIGMLAMARQLFCLYIFSSKRKPRALAAAPFCGLIIITSARMACPARTALCRRHRALSATSCGKRRARWKLSTAVACKSAAAASAKSSNFLRALLLGAHRRHETKCMSVYGRNDGIIAATAQAPSCSAAAVHKLRNIHAFTSKYHAGEEI